MPPAADAYYHAYFQTGIDYYLIGRAAAIAQRSVVAASLLHHAVELLLKGELSRTQPVADFKRRFNHNLDKTWKDFKALHPAEDLSGFDQLIAELDRFETIRYPDHYVQHGARILVGWATKRPVQPKGHTTPKYELYVNEVDSLVARVLKVCSMNPRAYFVPLNPAARDFLEHMNSECNGWTGSHPDPLSQSGPP